MKSLPNRPGAGVNNRQEEEIDKSLNWSQAAAEEEVAPLTVAVEVQEEDLAEAEATAVDVVEAKVAIIPTTRLIDTRKMVIFY
jgi:hypothetical protein